MDVGLVLFLGLVVLYAVYSRWLGRFSITMPMIFVFVGALIGPHALDWVEFSFTASSVETLTEVTLANWYARRLETAGPDAPELVGLPELPTRHRAWTQVHLPQQ